MRRIILAVLILSLTGCATMRRHPLRYGVAAGIVVGVGVAALTHQGCHHYEPGDNGVNVPCPHYGK